MTASDPALPLQAALPAFEVGIEPPDLAPWREGNTGIPGFTSHAADAAGPHVLLLALMHGNEFAGAIVLDRLLRAKLRPLRGRLTLGFANLAAFDSFDAANPTASRFVDEDLNRLWDPALLDGGRSCVELARAREIRPAVEAADVVLDLHSMLWPSDPLILSGATARGRCLAEAIGAPGLVVADRGHCDGPRLIDHPRFASDDGTARALLVEAGQHWEAATVEMAAACVAGLLHHLGLSRTNPTPPVGQVAVRRSAEVTQVVTAQSAGFTFVRGFRGGEVIAHRNTLIALDGTIEIRTPHDDCLLVMPSLRPSRGHTAVRLARFVA
ncbi:MAG: succinylglutamate desuccinylase/aspartoacylase family protein [Acetobacteraceae bacterium]|nr:succinylglutamate desuccinylase/aspartoacylase family protein [Acetobacteraceae bacterium]